MIARTISRTALLGTAAILAIASPLAHAAEDPPATDGATAETGGGVQDIVVTATRRRETQQSVPLSVTAISGAMAKAAGITDVQSIQAIAPSLEFPRYFNNATPALRGVGTNSAIGAQESVVALYIDDVYVASPAATTFSFNNIEQVAVLKGPQGTLFGRNAMAGVIQITTRDPGQSTRVDAQMGLANYNTISGSLYAATPITDRLAADIALTGSHQGDGWGKNLSNGRDAFKEKFWAARSK